MIDLRKDVLPHVLHKNGKTDGSYVNRPFCVACWRKQRERRKKAAPQLTFFCFFSSKKKRRRPSEGLRFPRKLTVFSSKKKRRGTFSFLEEKKQKTLRGRFSFGEKDVSRTSDPIVQKNGRFPYEPSVLCNTLAKATGTQKESCSAIDFLLLPFLSRKKRKTPISAAVQWRGSRPRSPPYPRSPPRPRCNGPYDPSE